MHLLFKYHFALVAIFRSFLTAGAVPLGSMLWTSVGFLLGCVASLISLMGYILLGCCRVLPSACLFSGSLEFIHKCGLLFFSMGTHTFFFSFVFLLSLYLQTIIS